MSTYHPETDCKSERTIQTLEDLLHACVIDFGGYWGVHLLLADFSFNNNDHTSVKAASRLCMVENADHHFVGPKLRKTTDGTRSYPKNHK